MSIREKINWFKNNPNYIYFDNGATTLKPECVLDAIKEYIDFDCTNPHNTDSNFAYKAYVKIDELRQLLSEYLNCDKNQVILTSGATSSLNTIANFLSDSINSKDKIIITNAEHSSNILPWYEIRKKSNCEIFFVKTNIKDNQENEDSILNAIDENTKIVSFANQTNLIGNKYNAELLSKKIKEKNPNVTIIVDATQYLSFSKMDLKNSSIDFVVGSAHKMMGPTGIGLLYISNEIINKITPTKLGGGMNHQINRNDYTLIEGVEKFEAGTLNMMGIYAWCASLRFYKEIDANNELNRVYELKKYLDSQLLKNPNIIVFNDSINSSITIFKYKEVFSQDLAGYLGEHNIILRSGLSCAKLANEILGVDDVLRISLHFYNTKEDVDKFIEVLNNYNIGDDLELISYKDEAIARQIIMDHYQEPNHKIIDVNAFVDIDKYESYNYKSNSCIDNITVYLKIENSKIIDAKFSGVGCAISSASTDIMCEKLINNNFDFGIKLMNQYFKMINNEEYNEKLIGKLVVFKGVSNQMNRIKCALVGMNAITNIIGEK